MREAEPGAWGPEPGGRPPPHELARPREAASALAELAGAAGMEGAELRAFWMDPMEQGGSHVLRVRVVGRGDPASVAAAYGRARAAVRGRPVSGGPTWPGPCLTLAPDGVTVLGITGWGDGGEGAGLCVFAAVPVLGEAGAQEAWASMSPLLGPAAARAALSAFF